MRGFDILSSYLWAYSPWRSSHCHVRAHCQSSTPSSHRALSPPGGLLNPRLGPIFFLLFFLTMPLCLERFHDLRLGQVSLVLSVPPHSKLDASCCLRLPPAPAAVGFNNAMISNVGMVLRNIYSKKYLVNYKVGKVWCAGYGNDDCWSVACYR